MHNHTKQSTIVLPKNIYLLCLEKFFFKKKYTKVVVLMDYHTKKYCYPLLIPCLPIHQYIVIPPGEKRKNIQTSVYIWKKMMQYSLDRHSILINLGGGVICDIGAFCASTYQRGIAYINVPTTLIAQVDASIGGKTGINLFSYKNQIGTFHQPTQVWISPIFLKTLSNNLLYAGYFEMLKHSLIADEAYFYNLIHTNKQQACYNIQNILKSIHIKYTITNADSKEKNKRKLLNFGHTVGHAIESYFLATKKPITHGEAIAIGMICETYIAYKKNMLIYKTLKTIIDSIYKHIKHIKIPLNAIDILLQYIKMDKKKKYIYIYFTLIKNIGKGIINIPVCQKQIKDALIFYQNILSLY